MKPVFMTETAHVPDLGLFGDCMRACVASILELPPQEVPHFTDKWTHDREHDEILREFLLRFGLNFMTFRVPAAEYEQACADFMEAKMDAHHLLGGMAGSGIPHWCVGQYGRVVFDPRPDPSQPDYGKLGPDPATDCYELVFFVKR